MSDPAVMMNFEGHLYRNSGTAGSPTWNELDQIKDVSVDLPLSEKEVTTRGDGSVKRYHPGQMDPTIEFKILKDAADSDYTALKAAFEGRTLVDVAFTDAAVEIGTAGAKYFRCPCKIFSFKTEESDLDDAQFVSVKLRPCKSADVTPGYYTTAS